MSVQELPVDDVVGGEPTASSSRRLLTVGVVLTLLAASVLGVLWIRGAGRGGTTKPATAAAGTLAAVPPNAQMEDRYGLRVTSVEITAGGGMIQMRYQVLDTDKAAAMHDETIGPFVVDAAGALYDAPGMMGHSHGRVPGLGGTGYVLLANTNGGVHPGDLVTIKMGTLTITGVKVL